MTAPHLEVDVARELTQLSAEPDGTGGRRARTLVKLDDLRVVLMTLKAGARIPGHHAKGGISIQVVSGHILVRAQGCTYDLLVGGLLAIAKDVVHDVEATDDSAFLLTIALPGGARTTPPLGATIAR